MLTDSDLFDAHISVALIGEYEAVSKRLLNKMLLTADDIEDILDYVCDVSSKTKIFFLWRPFLRDPDDDMVLELAVAAQCRYIVTFNQRDFTNVEKFGIQAILPGEFLSLIGELP